MPAAITIEPDFVAMQEYEESSGEWPKVFPLSPELLNEIGNLPYVRNYDYSAITEMFSDELESFVKNEEVTAGRNHGKWNSFTLKGVQNATFLDVEEGIIALTQGRTFTADEINNLTYVALLSQNVAEKNSLGVGSVFTMRDIVWDYRGQTVLESTFFEEENIYASQYHDFELIGIYSTKVEMDTGDEWMDLQIQENIDNRIYVPNTIVEAAQRFQVKHMREMEPDDEFLNAGSEELVWYQNVFILNDALAIEGFEKELRAIVPAFYTVVDLSVAYKDIVSSIETLRSFSFAILWAAVSATVFIISLIIILFLRDRRHEIGVYLALGEKRRTVIIQIILEVLIVAMAAISLSLLVGSFLSDTISTEMLRQDLLAAQMMSGDMSFGTLNHMGFAANPSPDEMLANYNVSLNATTILIFYAISIATVVIATILPMFYIVRLNPKKILM